MAELVKKVKEVLKSRNLTRKAFAQYAGISQFTLRKFLAEVTEQKPDTLEKIIDAVEKIEYEDRTIRENTIKAWISYETIAEADIEVKETIIDTEKNITQREYKNPLIRKTIEIRKDKFKIVRTLGECVKIEPQLAYVKSKD